jgi:hypothetical protein
LYFLAHQTDAYQLVQEYEKTIKLFLFQKGLVGHVVGMGEERSVYRVLVEKPEGKRPMGRPSCRWEDNTKMDLQ